MNTFEELEFGKLSLLCLSSSHLIPLVIGDFGESKLVSTLNKAKTVTGTGPFIAPVSSLFVLLLKFSQSIVVGGVVV